MSVLLLSILPDLNSLPVLNENLTLPKFHPTHPLLALSHQYGQLAVFGGPFIPTRPRPEGVAQQPEPSLLGRADGGEVARAEPPRVNKLGGGP